MPHIHLIVQGDTIPSLAFQYGLFSDSLWQHPENADLRKLRGDPNVLMPGDKVFVPDKILKQVDKADGARHRFQRRGVPMKFRVQLLDKDRQPRANLKYTLDVEGQLLKGATDSEGVIEHWLSPAARTATLRLGEEVYHFAIGALDPEASDKGVRARLANLGYLANVDGSASDQAAALRAFQADRNLTVTGKADDATRAELTKAHHA